MIQMLQTSAKISNIFTQRGHYLMDQRTLTFRTTLPPHHRPQPLPGSCCPREKPLSTSPLVSSATPSPSFKRHLIQVTQQGLHQFKLPNLPTLVTKPFNSSNQIKPSNSNTRHKPFILQTHLSILLDV